MKTKLWMAGALVVLFACNKSETVIVQNPGEIAFKAFAGNMTKAAAPEITGTEFAHENELYVAASTANNPDFFSGVDHKGQLFKWDGTGQVETGTGSSTNHWRAYTGDFTPIYWPLNEQRVDFLAYASKAAKIGAGEGQIQPVFDATTPANQFSVTWDTWDKQIDLLYAVANNKYKDSPVSAVPLVFKHTQALIIFNAKASAGPNVKIDKFTFTDLKTSGRLDVYNDKTDPYITWTSLTPAEVTPKDFQTDADAVTTAINNTTKNTGVDTNPACGKFTDEVEGDADEIGASWKQIGNDLLVIPQEQPNVTIHYRLATDSYVSLYSITLNLPRKTWEAGKVYFYNIEFHPYEITVNPSVSNWETGGVW